MIRADEIRDGSGQIPFSMAALKDTRVQPKMFSNNEGLAVAMPNIARGEINISGSQLLVGFTSALSLTGLLLWAFLRLWLFER